MAYTINLTDGSIFATVSDGTINTDTSITIIGKNYAGYGEFLGENFIRLLENSANATAPANPLRGQLWFDSGAGLLKVYNGTTWKNMGAATSQAAAPTINVIGDLWFDTVNSQLNVWDGTQFILVGPAFTAGTGVSGAIVDTVKDSVNVDHVVIKLYTEDDIVGIVSKDTEFTPASPITGFTTIKPGIQLADNIGGEIPLFQGKAANADLLGGVGPAGYLSSTSNDTTSGTLGVLNDGGLTVGADGDIKLLVSGTNALVRSSTANNDMILQVHNGVSFVDVITLDGATGKASTSNPTAASHIATKDYVDLQVTGGTSGVLLADGSVGIQGVLKPLTDNVYQLGQSSFRFSTIHAVTFSGKATTAQYADLAERFHSDQAYEPGTVVQLGGVAEITKAAEDLSEDVFGVISTNAAFLMNSDAGADDTHPPIAMSGRVPVRVIGEVTKGDRLVSAGNGLARAALPGEATSFNVIGRALESKFTEGEGVIEAFVTVN